MYIKICMSATTMSNKSQPKSSTYDPSAMLSSHQLVQQQGNCHLDSPFRLDAIALDSILNM